VKPPAFPFNDTTARSRAKADKIGGRRKSDSERSGSQCQKLLSQPPTSFFDWLQKGDISATTDPNQITSGAASPPQQQLNSAKNCFEARPAQTLILVE